MFNFNSELINIAEKAERLCAGKFAEIRDIARFNGEKVLRAFTQNRVSTSHFNPTDGYGYGDCGREKTDEIFAAIFGTESAIARHNFISGTHAISTALFGVLRPGDLMLSLTGAPYDTLKSVIHSDTGGSLKEFGIKYKELEFGSNLHDNAELIKACKIAYIQRSRGYTLRHSLSVSDINSIVKSVKEINNNAIIVTDNCYGEFCEIAEPNADLIIGSLIKNPGGGVARTGGYIAGRKNLTDLCAQRLSAVGIGTEAGCTLGMTREILLGIFLAPEITANALLTTTFASALFELLGYETFPKYNEKRVDLPIAIKLGSREKLIAFCRAVQAASPIDSYAVPEPWAMPGYDSDIIMASGAFTMGSSIELSADAPLREPWAVWLQGGLTYTTGRIGVLNAAQSILNLSN
ncbi:MAG: methionine gamma-lyase family protein [Oscillospiraceae bacterium]|jgi:cystathionine beta-lyase family protein involved in aluminum resistance|nr:methionine gamma-lyase family protein [Oscillospiraceae bacterium]